MKRDILTGKILKDGIIKNCEVCKKEFYTMKQSRDFIADWKNWPQELDNKAFDYKKGSYFEVDGPFDFFDNIRSTLWLNKEEKRGVLVGAEWRPSWSSAPNGIVKSVDFSEPFFGHAFLFFGWKEIEGEPYLVAQLSNGNEFGDNGIFYFSRNIVNGPAFRFGGFTFKDFSQEEYKKLQWNLIQKLKDLIVLYQRLIAQKLGQIRDNIFFND